MVLSNIPTFDGGAWLLMIVVAFTCLILSKKISVFLLPLSVVFFLICGWAVVVGEDVVFFHTQNPTISTVTLKNGTGGIISTQTTVITIPENETNYLIGNGQFPITGTVQLIVGWGLIGLAVFCAGFFIVQTAKGRFFAD